MRLSTQAPPIERRLNGEQEERVIATRLGPPPKWFTNWSLWLLARQVVTLEIVGAISHKRSVGL